ncbi:MAG: RagB/SusD family nutrient uptake outer membrane protein [Candidatus Marinimicrobia bacterium]|jgi:hypothetical protein|nr:RagB/SusD family nutrient uptake outer membrane protein [Candidatus Neomarinimicrobiota bacterium]
MKKINQIITSFSVLFISSCGVLDHDPQNAIVPEQAFDSEASVRSAVIGLYHQMQSDDYYGASFQYAADNYADISTYAGFYTEYKEADERVMPTTNALAENIWLGVYRVVNGANEIIDGVPGVEDATFTDEEKTEIIAEAKCIRALGYLDLLVHYGEHWDLTSEHGLPLITKSTNSDYANIDLVSRSSVQETYNLILNDLESAEAGLPDSDNRTVATKALAQCLLARTHLHMQDYASAITYASLVIGNANFSLNPSFSDIFQSDLTSESVFELVSTSLDQSSLAVYTIIRDEVLPDEELKASFSENDSRRVLIGPVEGKPNERFLKAEDFSSHANPAYVIRMGEVYLFRAEAKHFSGDDAGALEDLNAVRTRAGLEPYADSNDFLNKYMDENRWELFAEGKRLSTLTRIGKAQEVLGIEDFRRIYPIPFREFTIEGNQLVQNPGY